MTNVRTIHVDWYSQRPPRFSGGPQLAYQGDHLSNMVVFDNAPELPNYYLLVEMKTDDAGPVVALPGIQLEGPYWVIPNYYTQICQQITYQVCCKTESGDFEHHSAKFKGTILPVIKHNGEPIDQSPMFDPYIDILDKRVDELIVAAGDIQIDSELKSDSTNPVQNKIVKAAIDDLTDDVDAVNGRLDQQKEDVDDILEVKSAQSANLIDMSKFTVVGQYYASAAGVSGSHNDNASYISYGPLIKVKPSTTYTLSDKYRHALNAVSLLMTDSSGTAYLGGGYNQSSPFTTTDDTEYIRLSVAKSRFDLGKIMLEEGSTPSSIYIPYFESYKYAEALEQGVDIVCWGDSLTYGTGKTSDAKSYPAVLSQKTGRKVRSCAFPGDTSIEIAGMQGAAPMMVKAPFTIPASGSVDIDIYDELLSSDTPFRFPSIDATAGVNPVTIGGIKGNLDLSASGNPSGRTFTFTRLADGDAKTFTWWEPLITNCSTERKSDIAVIWIGTNGGWDGNVQSLANQIRQMTEYIKAVDRKYIVIGLTTGTAQSRASLETLFTNVFGSHFVNARAYMSEQAIYDQGITPTENDLADMAEGKTPESLRYDATHLNDKGYNAIATIVYNRGKVLGYWN